MLFRSLVLLGASALLPVACAAAPAPEAVTIELRATTTAGQGAVTLADVASVSAAPALQAELAALEVGRAPRVGYVERLTRAQIEHALRRRAGVTQVNWSGAQSVTLRTASQTITAARLEQAAVSALTGQFASPALRLSVQVAQPPADLEVAAGAIELRPRRAAALSPRMAQWIDLLVEGKVYRSAVVQLKVEARQQVYAARRALQQGERVGADDFTVTDADIAGVPAIAAGVPLAPFRLRHSLASGQLLSPEARLDSGKVLRGDAVKLMIMSGQIGVETAAIAMADAAPGQLLAVRPNSGSDIVTGRVGPSGTVTLE